MTEIGSNNLKHMVDWLDKMKITAYRGNYVPKIDRDALLKRMVDAHNIFHHNISRLSKKESESGKSGNTISALLTIWSKQAYQERKKNFVIIDPSCFLSRCALKDMIKFLLALKTNRKNIKILIPSILDDLIFNLCDKQRLGGIVEIFHGWLPTIPEEFIEEIILDLCRDEKFMDLNKSLLEFKPQKIAEDEKRFTKQGENRELIPKEEAVRILGENTGSIIYEILQLSMRGEAKVLGVGNETIRMLERLWKKVEINSLSDDYDLHTMCLTYNSIFNNFRVSEIWEDINP